MTQLILQGITVEDFFNQIRDLMPQPLPPQPEPKYYTTGQIAKLMGCSEKTVVRATDSGKIPVHYVPNTTERRYLLHEVQAAMKAK